MFTIILKSAVLLLCLIHPCANYFGTEINFLAKDKFCFCKLEGQIKDCDCDVRTVDHYNNVKIRPRIESLVQKDYFRFYKVNLNKKCPFWEDDSACSMRYCHVEHCTEADLPHGLKKSSEVSLDMTFENLVDHSVQYTKCKDDHLGSLNTTISPSALEEFKLWQAHDYAQDNYCTLPDDDLNASYVDLTLNAERYTGYGGKSAHRVWRSIYTENCFRPDHNYGILIPSDHLNVMCLEKRVFYRVISGLHASINIHLCAEYLLSDSFSIAAVWGLNKDEFKRRFSPENTEGEGPTWLQNLYFLYLLELKALVKATPYLQQELFYTGNITEDEETRFAINDFLDIVKQFPNHFDETSMFAGSEGALALKDQFRAHFRNISDIMDCVGCEKCKLWGKLQIQGLGTALKILFSGKFDKPYLVPKTEKFQLQRSEIVTLFNSFCRLSSSIYHLEIFKND